MSVYNLIVADVHDGHISVMIEGNRPPEDMTKWTPATRLIMVLSTLCQNDDFLHKATGGRCNPVAVSVADNIDMVKAAMEGKSS